ncbi:Nuclease-related domain-containing protein [Lachnospiraceae bacterium]|nr:Nuclease-related domain-containing protein [Lachnospiraceae bacterium]
MAIMHPHNLSNYDPTESERVFFEELERQLDDSFHVFYSVKWYGTDFRGERVNSECDFLIFSSNFGYLTIEVKGGKRIEVNDRHWILYYTNSEGEQESRDLGKGPYHQADRSMYYFFDYYKKETFSKFQGSYGMAVAFPFFNVDVALENDAPKELTIQLSDMGNLKKRINDLFHYWSKRNKGTFLSNSQATKFVGLVNKRVALSVAAGALIPITERKLETINVVQDAVISILTNYNRIQIVGGAGTGKTWIAIKKIQQQVLCGKKCLYTCYSSSLCQYVEKQINNELVDCVPIETLFARTIGKINAADLPQDARGDIKYYDVLAGINKKKYDCIMVDEAQDLSEDWARSLNLYIRPDGIFWVFFDENQNIYNRRFGKGFGIDTEPYLLLNNIRNTRNIHSWIKGNTQIGDQIISNDICGCDPEIYDYHNTQQVGVFLNSVLNQLITEESVPASSVVVLVNDNRLCEWSEQKFGRYKLSKDSLAEDEVKISTVSDFKGLEACIVIYLNDWPNGLTKNKDYYNRLYVAGTRAKYYLYVVNY